ncbi:MAG: GyrI-like domain-containing protein [Chitinophagales bacterium]
MSQIPTIKFVQKGTIHLIGMSIFGNFLQDPMIPKLWQEFDPYIHKIPNRVNIEQCFGLEVYTDSFMKTKQWHYMTAVEVSSLENIPIFASARTLPPNRYAVFTHKGLVSNISQTFDYIYSTWLPNSDYEIAAPYDFEFYDERFKEGQSEDSETDIYLPVRAKNAG